MFKENCEKANKFLSYCIIEHSFGNENNLSFKEIVYRKMHYLDEDVKEIVKEVINDEDNEDISAEELDNFLDIIEKKVETKQ